MTDKELLEYAAKAASMTLGAWREDYAAFMYRDASPGSGYWNPLTDDGDALRLAVRLEIFTGRFYDCSVPACYALWHKQTRSLWEPAADDTYAATRRAIVRAAAEIGKAM